MIARFSNAKILSLDDSNISDTGIGMCGWILFSISWMMVVITLPFSLCVLLKVRMASTIKEYQTLTTCKLHRRVTFFFFKNLLHPSEGICKVSES